MSGSRVFKKPVEYDPNLASRTLGSNPLKAHNLQLLLDLGLADEDNDAGKMMLIGSDEEGEDNEVRTGMTPPKATTSRADALQTRTNEAIQVLKRLRLSAPDPSTQHAALVVEPLLVELQREVEVVWKGNRSLRQSMEDIRKGPPTSTSASTRVSSASPRHEEGDSWGAHQVEPSVQKRQEPNSKDLSRTCSSCKDSAATAAALSKQVQELSSMLKSKNGEVDILREHCHCLEVQQQISTTGAPTQRQPSAAEVKQLQMDLERSQQEATNLQEQLKMAQSEVKHLRETTSRREAEDTPSQFNREVELLHQQLSRSQSDVAQWQSTAEKFQKEVAELKRAAQRHAQVEEEWKETIQKLQCEVKQLDQSLHSKDQVAHQVQKQKEEAERLAVARQGKLEETERKLVMAQQEVQQVRHTVAQQVQELSRDLATAQEQLATVESRANERVEAAEREARELVAQFREKWRVEFERRKQLHNQVLELKGNIRVLCRVRPFLEKETVATGMGSAEPAIKVKDSETVMVVSEKGDKTFEFDRVFEPSDGQDKVFEEVCALSTSVLDGFNVCILAYGQTGSGKTFTMEGPPQDPGVNWRALNELFRVAQERQQEVEYTFMASVLEIYNEQIFDLLAGNREAGEKLDVKEGPEGMYVQGLKLVSVPTLEEVAMMIARGKQNRTTFATNMNEHSSRSHLVLSIYVTAENKISGVATKGKLHLIDLAGSERLSRTGAQGDRLKEAQNINKSLSALGDVIQALQQRSAHVPYRNSKLTRLLEDSLGGSSKCVMFVNCSPALENAGETKCSLDFASRARKVELGKAKQNVVEDAGAGRSSPVTPASPALRHLAESPRTPRGGLDSGSKLKRSVASPQSGPTWQ